jgi:5-methylcytosine-specific restriction enzyme B
MTESVVEREKLWDAFLQRWPLLALPNLHLEEYTQADNRDTFVYWMEFGTQTLGSMRGGGAFKFGIYCRKGQVKEKREHFAHDDTYSWYAKYGATHDEAFEKVKELVVACANAARQGNLSAIDAIDLGDVYKWKLAFLYQDRQAPIVLPIYKAEHLRAAVGSKVGGPKYPELYKQLLAGRGDASVFECADRAWEKASAALAQVLTPDDAMAFFGNQPERFYPIHPPSQDIAGFSILSGRQLALVRDNKEATLFLAPGPWRDMVVDQLGKIQEYPPEKSRNGDLATHAPDLSQGRTAFMVRVPTKNALIALCDAYDDTDAMERGTMEGKRNGHFDGVPLNQILYGPPGTGKTYATVEAALEVLDPAFLAEHASDRPALKARFDSLMGAGHVRFVTFHQSFSYEDFVEGLRADSGEDGQLRYEVVPGVFKSLCDAAAVRVTQQAEAPLDLTGRRIWKMSLGNTLGGEAYLYDECIEQGYALLGWGGAIDFSGAKDRDDVHQRFVAAGDAVSKDSYAVTALVAFVLKIKPGDLVVVSEGNSKFRAIGQFTGDYRHVNRDEQGDNFGQCRRVKWLRVYQPALPLDQLMHNQFSQMTLYELKPSAIDLGKMAGLLGTAPIETSAVAGGLIFQLGERFTSGYVVRHTSADILELEKPNGCRLPLGMSLLRTLADYVRSGALTIDDIREKKVFDKIPESKLEKYLVNGYNNVLPPLVERLCGSQGIAHSPSEPNAAAINAKVLIIDEINRGNVSRIFGELITLIEHSKRQGEDEALEVTLPYSKERFSVPKNVYLIGTMNSADRSLAGIDIALRRRFTFREMPPKPSELETVEVDGVNIGRMLLMLNQRIEVLLDRDHCLGHAYFLSLKGNAALPRLASIFRLQILPLLQEYFFEDWEHIRWALNDHRKPSEYQFVQAGTASHAELFGNDVPGLANIKAQWQLNEHAFGQIESYAGIIKE